MSAGDFEGTVVEVTTPRDQQERDALMEVARAAVTAATYDGGVPHDADVSRRLLQMSAGR
jgi:hypothetical protein